MEEARIQGTRIQGWEAGGKRTLMARIDMLDESI
jgi:hypothetical protein